MPSTFLLYIAAILCLLWGTAHLSCNARGRLGIWIYLA